LVYLILLHFVLAGSPLQLGLRRQNGRIFYVRVQRSQVKGQQQQQQQQPAEPMQQRVAPAPKPLPGPPPRQQVSPSASKDGEIVGIGIGLALDNEHNLCISSLLPGSPALRSGLLEEGDVLRYVDGIDVRGMTPEGVRPKILGKTGTFVTVSVQRGNTQIVARLARARPLSGAAPYVPKAGSTDAPKADTNTYSAVYAQVTAERQTSPQQNAGLRGYSATQNQAQNAPAEPEQPADQELCGIGVVLAQNPEGELLVSSMNEGGPAARSNLIKQGDVMHTIDNVDVYCQTIDQVRPLIVGLPGSTVVLGFQRPGMRRPVNVRLRRGTIKTDLKNIPNPSPRPSPSATPGGGATPKQSPHHTPRQSPSQTPVSTRPSSPKLQAQQRSGPPPGMPDMRTMQRQQHQPENEVNKYGPDGPVCGLGIVLVPTPFGALCVASITDGGPAARSGRIYRGDFVETIDDKSVTDMTINAVRPLILGRAGTVVTLGLRRESEDSVVHVRIMREPVRLGEVLVPGMRPTVRNNCRRRCTSFVQ
jgi:C-terminal processing protease CtpA/Prc